MAGIPKDCVVRKLGTIEQELARCKKAFKGVRKRRWAWHCHHRILVEKLTHTPVKRMEFIIRHKDTHEVALRLRLFRPVKSKLFVNAIREQERFHGLQDLFEFRNLTPQLKQLVRKLHPIECKCCTFEQPSGKPQGNIFPATIERYLRKHH